MFRCGLTFFRSGTSELEIEVCIESHLASSEPFHVDLNMLQGAADNGFWFSSAQADGPSFRTGWRVGQASELGAAPFGVSFFKGCGL